MGILVAILHALKVDSVTFGYQESFDGLSGVAAFMWSMCILVYCLVQSAAKPCFWSASKDGSFGYFLVRSTWSSISALSLGIGFVVHLCRCIMSFTHRDSLTDWRRLNLLAYI
jgi:hypothetical protein